MRRFQSIISVLMVVALLGGVQVEAASGNNNPVLKVTEVSESVLSSNSAYDLTIVVENIGNSYGKDLSLTLIPEIESPIVMTEQISYKHFDNLNPNVPIEVTYAIRVDSNAEPGYYTMTLDGTMQNDDGDQVSYIESFMVEVVKGDNDVDFEIIVSDETKLVADSEMSTYFIIDNNGKGGAQDVTVSFGDNEDVGVFAVGDTERYLATIKSHQAITFNMNLLIDDDVSGYVPLEFDVTYDSGISIVTDTVKAYVNVEDSEDASILIKSITKSASTIVPDQKVTFTVVVENTSDIDSDYVKVEISQESDIVPISQSAVMIDSVIAGGTETIQFVLEATESASSMNYPVEFTLEYEGESTSQYAGVYIDNDDDDDDDVVSKPRIVVTDFNISNDQIFVGDTFDIVFDVLNTSSLKDVRNLKVTLDTTSSSSTTESFMPLNQSSSYFVGDLSMNESSNISIPLKVFANADGKSYSMVISFEYEGLDGEFYEDSETISIPVYEKTELTVSDVRVGSTLDNGYTLEVDFYNTGKVDITNMMVDLEGDFQATNSNYYVGDFATGRTDIYDVEITGTKPDVLTGKIVFTYDDTFGEEETFSKAFTVGESDEEGSAGVAGTGPGGGNRTGGTDEASASGRADVTSLTDEQRAELADMTQEERVVYIESIQDSNGTTEGIAGVVPSDMFIYIIGGSLIVLVAIAAFLIRRKRKVQ